MSSHKNTSGTKKQNQRPGVFPNLTRSFHGGSQCWAKKVTFCFFWGPTQNQMKWGMDFRVPWFFGITRSWTQKHKKNNTQKILLFDGVFFEWVRYFVGKSMVSFCGMDSGGGWLTMASRVVFFHGNFFRWVFPWWAAVENTVSRNL